MKKTASHGAMWLIGVIFSLVGGGFMILGLGLWIGLRNTEVWMLGSIFGIVGGLFFVIGLCLALAEKSACRRRQRIMDGGRYVWGEIVAVEPDYAIRINSRNPFYAVVRCRDAGGKVHMLRSESRRELWFREDLKGRQVKVYIEDGGFDRYAVDLASLLSE